MIKVNQIKINPVIIYLLTSLFLIFEMGVQVSPSVMTHQLMSDLHINAYQLGLMSGFYFYTYAFFQIPSGILFDTFNPRLVISTSIIVCSLGVLAFAFSPNLYVSICARLLMGAGSAFAFLSVLVVTADLFDHKYFAFLVGITQMLAALGAMMGQAPLGRLVLLVGWRHTMIILTMVGFILSLFILVCVNYRRPHLQHAAEHRILTNLKNIISAKQTWLIGLYAFLMWTPISGFASLWGVPYLMSVFHLSFTAASFVCSFMWLGLAFASPVLGFWSTRIGKRVLPLTLSSLIGFFSFAGILFFHINGVWLIAVLVFIAGAACSGQALSFSLIRENNPEHQRATAIAINNIAVVLPGVVFQPLIGKLLMVFSGTSQHASTMLNYSSLVFRESISIILLGYFIAALCAFWFIKETYCLPLEQPH